MYHTHKRYTGIRFMCMLHYSKVGTQLHNYICMMTHTIQNVQPSYIKDCNPMGFREILFCTQGLCDMGRT